MLIVTRSNGRLRYMRHVLTRSGISATHGAHQVAQKLTRTVFSVAFARIFLTPGASIFSSVTGSFLNRATSVFADDLPIHLIEHPTVGVVSTSTGLPASTASIAFRVSGTFA